MCDFSKWDAIDWLFLLFSLSQRLGLISFGWATRLLAIAKQWKRLYCKVVHISIMPRMASTSHKPKTRKMTTCPVFGAPEELSDNVLPTYESLMKSYMLLRHQIKSSGTVKEPSVANISQQLAAKVEQIWVKASIPTVSHDRVLQLIRGYHDKYVKLIKPPKARQASAIWYQTKLRCFRDECKNKLFDIAACNFVAILQYCAFSSCVCEKARKVLASEQRNEDFIIIMWNE